MVSDIVCGKMLRKTLSVERYQKKRATESWKQEKGTRAKNNSLLTIIFNKKASGKCQSIKEIPKRN